MWTPSGQFSPHAIVNTPSPIVSPRQEAYAMRQQAMSYSAGSSPQDAANMVLFLLDLMQLPSFCIQYIWELLINDIC